MDILTHTLSGIAVGTVMSSFTNSGLKNKIKIITLSGLAGALPDLDTISLWSKFDATIGTFFNLSIKGKEIYFSKYWFSHRAFMHSLIAALLFTLLITTINYITDSKSNTLTNKSYTNFCKNNKIMMISFFLGFSIHLFEDMPTPSSTWGGVNLFFPYKFYVGGTGDIWWWNNYDIFLIVICVIVVNIVLLIISQLTSFNARNWTIMVFLLGVIIGVNQIKNRNFDFSYAGHTNQYQLFERQSKQIQKEILGNDLYNIMKCFDNSIKIYF